VQDLPAVWDAGMEQRFGARPASLAEGCLQDVHWAVGFFGYFPSYVLGAAIAAQLWEALRAHRPGVEDEISRGDFTGLFGWLREHVHSQAAKLPIKELVKQASGQPLGANALLRYLDHKYLES
jgi:carboxypeptidase Taq